MNKAEILKQRILPIDMHIRVALLAECATRVFPIYKEYWVGTYYEEVFNSINIAWDFALGNVVNEKEYQNCLVEVDDIVNFYSEEGISILGHSVSVVSSLLYSMVVNEEKSSHATVFGLFSSLDTAASAEAMANIETPINLRKKIAVLEEKEWQEKAICLAENWNGKPTKNMFDSLSANPPNWIINWRKRCKLGN